MTISSELRDRERVFGFLVYITHDDQTERAICLDTHYTNDSARRPRCSCTARSTRFINFVTFFAFFFAGFSAVRQVGFSLQGS